MTKMRAGARNLVLLGLAATLIAAATTGMSLAIYHNSGDIYLDRSRPGFLPEEDEEAEEAPTKYEMEKSGKIDKKVIEEYLENLELEVEAVDEYAEPFAAEALSDERLGIPVD